jgi:DNA-directed RNA polymerase specialized sigma24 family protein
MSPGASLDGPARQETGCLDFKRLYVDNRRELERFVRRARRRSNSLRVDQVQDAVQEAFKVVLERAAAPAPPPWRDAKKYLFGVCLRVVARLRREQRRMGPSAWADHAAPTADEGDELVLTGLEAMVTDWWRTQTAEVRVFLDHRYVQGLSLRTCAALLGTTVWCMRALERRVLRELMLAISGRDGAVDDQSWARGVLRKKLRTNRLRRKRT